MVSRLDTLRRQFLPTGEQAALDELDLFGIWYPSRCLETEIVIANQGASARLTGRYKDTLVGSLQFQIDPTSHKYRQGVAR